MAEATGQIEEAIAHRRRAEHILEGVSAAMRHLYV